MKGTSRNGSRRLGILMVVFLWLGCLFCSSAWAAPKAVVAHAGGGISFVDLKTPSLPVVERPAMGSMMDTGLLLDVVVTLDKKYALVSDYNYNKLYRIDITDPAKPVYDETTDTITLSSPMKPQDIAISPNGKWAVASDGRGSDIVAIINLQEFSLLTEFKLLKGKANAIAIAPDNQTVIISDFNGAQLISAVIDEASSALTNEQEINFPGNPRNLAISPDGKTVVAVSDTGVATYTLTRSALGVPTLGPTGSLATVKGQSIAFSIDGSKAYAYDRLSPQLRELKVNAASSTVEPGQQTTLDLAPSVKIFGVDCLAISPDGKYAVATDAGNASSQYSLAVIDLATLVTTYVTLIPDDPTGVAFIPMLPPTISGTPPATWVVGEEYRFTPTATNVPAKDGFTILNKPDWASFDPNSGLLSGMPVAGEYSGIVITATSEDGTASLAAFTITVTDNNHAPTISGTPTASVYRGGNYSFFPVGDDQDESDKPLLKYSIIGKPEWATFDEDTGALYGTPSAALLKIYEGIVISVSDGKATASLDPFSVTILNHLPQIATPTVTTATAGTPFSFKIVASDGDSDKLTYSKSEYPGWLSVDAATGMLTGTPSATDAGKSLPITITANDGWGETSLQFNITVSLPNRPPTFGKVPAAETTVYATEQYLYEPLVTDLDEDTPTFSISGQPGWATFNSTSGALSGTPTAAYAGTSSYVTISVTDKKSPAVSVSFTITVPDRPPVISGTPITSTTADGFYTFTPNGSDPDGGSVSYSITNKPAWANFDPQTGTLSGTPGASGTFANITISMISGKLSARLPAFDILVAPRCGPLTAIWYPKTDSTGTFTISWQNNMSGVTYVLEESIDGGKTYKTTPIYVGTQPRFIVKVPQNGSYGYRVKATKPGYSDSLPLTGIVDVHLVCSTPPNIKVPAASSTGVFTVSWDGTNIPGVTYNLKVTLGAETIATYSGTANQYAVSLPRNGEYTVSLWATKTNYDPSPPSERTCSVTFACSTPYITVPATNSTGSVTVSWGSGTAGVTYQVQELLGGQPTGNTYLGSLTQYTFKVLTSGTYSYKVVATKDGYVSSGEMTSGNCVVLIACPTPTGLTATSTPGVVGGVSLFWNPIGIAGASYELQESSDGFTYQPVATVSIVPTTTAPISLTRSSGTYYYRVRATAPGYAPSAYNNVGVRFVVL